MFRSCLLFVLVGLSAVPSLRASSFADAVVSYNPGTGFAKEFGSGLGYTNRTAILGEPSRVTPGQFGGPVDPFNPPYLREQILSIGAGGSVTIRFDKAILNDPSNPFGLDFIIFGNAGFSITNGNFSGGGITDGTLFGANPGSTRVSVSQDNQTFYELAPPAAPDLDGLFPTDGSGDFSLPVNPNLNGAKFSGLDLAGIRSLYAGSGGGTGFDIDWARSNGQVVNLESVNFIRVDVLSGAAEVDAVSAVAAASFGENFNTDPAQRGWTAFGDSNLFRWNRTNQNLEVTWDSSKPNSYFAHPLKTVLAKDDSFGISFDLKLSEISIGLKPSQPFTFQLAIGFLNWQKATNQNFIRGTGSGSPNLAEFNYFPDSGFGATISPVLVSSNNQFIPSFSFPLELTRGDLFQVSMSYSNQTLSTRMTRNGQSFGPIKDVKLPASFTDFRVDTFAVMSYNDQKSEGSLLVRGVVDNILIQSPAAALSDVRGRFVNRVWETSFSARTNWVYTLERSADLSDWKPVSLSAIGNGVRQTLRDEMPVTANAFYRIRAERP